MSGVQRVFAGINSAWGKAGKRSLKGRGLVKKARGGQKQEETGGKSNFLSGRREVDYYLKTNEPFRGGDGATEGGEGGSEQKLTLQAFLGKKKVSLENGKNGGSKDELKS